MEKLPIKPKDIIISMGYADGKYELSINGSKSTMVTLEDIVTRFRFESQLAKKIYGRGPQHTVWPTRMRVEHTMQDENKQVFLIKDATSEHPK